MRHRRPVPPSQAHPVPRNGSAELSLSPGHPSGPAHPLAGVGVQETSGSAAVGKGSAMWGLGQTSLQGHPCLPGPPAGTLEGLQGFGTSSIMSRVCTAGAKACGWPPRYPQFLGKQAAASLEGAQARAVFC